MTVKEKLQEGFQRVVARGLAAVERVQTGASWNPIDSGYLRNPYPTYRRLREHDPIHRSRLARGWVLTRYDDILSVMRDPGASVDGRKHPDYPKQRAKMEQAGLIEPGEDDVISMLTSDPPDHTRLRSLVSKAFTPRAVESLRPRIEQIVHEHLDAVTDSGRMDVIQDLAYPLPVIVIAEMLGVPASEREQFKAWSDDIVLGLGISSSLDDARRSRKAVRELQAYFARVAEERRREPREDLLSALVAAEEEGDRLTAAEVYQTCDLLLVAGHETTTNLIGNGLLALLRHREQWELLRNDPSLAEGAVEELLRYDSPVQATGRGFPEGFDLDGVHIEPWAQVFLLLGAGNRDPAQFPDPERLDITRKDVKPLSFGHGIHYCLGAPLARIEAPIALRAMVERFPQMRLATDRLDWNPNLILRGLKKLPVSF